MDGAALVAKVFDAFDRSADGYLDKDGTDSGPNPK